MLAMAEVLKAGSAARGQPLPLITWSTRDVAVGWLRSASTLGKCWFGIGNQHHGKHLECKDAYFPRLTVIEHIKGQAAVHVIGALKSNETVFSPFIFI